MGGGKERHLDGDVPFSQGSPQAGARQARVSGRVPSLDSGDPCLEHPSLDLVLSHTQHARTKSSKQHHHEDGNNNFTFLFFFLFLFLYQAVKKQKQK